MNEILKIKDISLIIDYFSNYLNLFWKYKIFYIIIIIKIYLIYLK